jgi:hypothetical protein
VTGIELARDVALLGALSASTQPPDEVGDAHAGWPHQAPAWTALGARMRQHEAAGDLLRRRLCADLGLSAPGYWLVVLCAAAEIHPEAAAAFSILAEDERVHLPTPLAFARLLRAALDVPLSDGLAEALPQGQARRLGLVEAQETVTGRPHTQHALRLAIADLGALLGAGDALGQARQVAWVEEPAGAALAYGDALVVGAATLLAERGSLCLRSASPRAGRQLALDIATHGGRAAQLVTVGDELPPLGELERLPRGLVVLDLTGWRAERPLPLGRLDELGRLSGGVVALVARGAVTGRLPAVDVPPLGLEAARRVWDQCLAAPDDALAARFRVSLDEARAAVREARDGLRLQQAPGGAAPTTADVAAAVLAQGARRMGRLALPLRSRARLEHLVAPPALRAQLGDIVGWYGASRRVHAEYGLARHSDLGGGLTCLFSGQPGTGKTFAAQCLANELGLNLYRIDLAQVVSKYIGETEKALSQVFDEVEAGHGVLLFDEADALFGKRSEVKDAHDRYANVEVGYLLQRLEAFGGVAILTTNLRANIDGAFLRRLRFVLEFPMPDLGWRLKLWEQALPDVQHRTADLEVAVFAQRFRLAGGHIQNIGLAAAHLAAAEGRKVDNRHLARATFRELEKSGLARAPSDFGPLARYLEGGGAP